MLKRMEIRDGARAAVFASPHQRRIVQILMGEELSLTALARECRLPVNLAHYHMAKCMAVGLVKVVREVRRAGRAIKYYRAVAKMFFVPAELTQELPGTAMARRLRDALDLDLGRTLMGIEFLHDGVRPRGQLLKDADVKSSSIELWLDASLDSQDVTELFSEMKSLIDRFRARSNTTGQRYLVNLAAAAV